MVATQASRQSGPRALVNSRKAHAITLPHLARATLTLNWLETAAREGHAPLQLNKFSQMLSTHVLKLMTTHHLQRTFRISGPTLTTQC